jgi:hypothetical protein
MESSAFKIVIDILRFLGVCKVKNSSFFDINCFKIGDTGTSHNSFVATIFTKSSIRPKETLLLYDKLD